MKNCRDYHQRSDLLKSTKWVLMARIVIVCRSQTKVGNHLVGINSWVLSRGGEIAGEN